MSDIKDFKEKYPNISELDRELQEIEELDISNIAKLDKKQEVVEKYKKECIDFSSGGSLIEKDTYLDEVIMGYGRG